MCLSQLTAALHQHATRASPAPNASHQYGIGLAVAWHNCVQFCMASLVHIRNPKATCLSAVVNTTNSSSASLPVANTAPSDTCTKFCPHTPLWPEWWAPVESSSNVASLALPTSSQQFKLALLAHAKNVSKFKKGRKEKRKSQLWSCCLLVIPVSNLETIRKHFTRELQCGCLILGEHSSVKISLTVWQNL